MLKQEVIDTLIKTKLEIKEYRMTRSLIKKVSHQGKDGEFIDKYEPGDDLYMLIKFKRPYDE